jgi:hypothetical protein
MGGAGKQKLESRKQKSRKRQGVPIVCWSRTVVPRPVNIGDFEDRARPMGRPRPSQALTKDHGLPTIGGDGSWKLEVGAKPFCCEISAQERQKSRSS